VRAIRDAIERRVMDLAGVRIDAIRSGRTAHQARLYRILPALITEFAHMHSDEEIRACADAVLATYDDVPARGFVMSLATRRACECLAAEHCDVLEHAVA
jgi:hypothetical protein